MEHAHGVPLLGHTTGKKIRPTISIQQHFLKRSDIRKALNAYAHDAGEAFPYIVHSFRSGGAVASALQRNNLSTIMQRAFWKQPRTAWRYLRLLEVMAPGSVGNYLVKRVTEVQNRESDEFQLNEQSKSWAAFEKTHMK